MRRAIQQSIVRILVGVDGSLTIEAKPDRLLGLEGSIGQLERREGRPALESNTLITGGGRRWKVSTSKSPPNNSET